MGSTKVFLLLSIVFNIAALLMGAISLGVPFWVIVEKNEGVIVANGTRIINAGLFLKREIVELKVSNSTHEHWDDESWRELTGKSFDTGYMTVVKVLLILGLCSLFLSLCTSITVFCCDEENRDREFMQISFGTFLATFIAVVLITTGTIVYATTVADASARKSLNVGFWLCVTSSVLAFISACFSIATWHLYRRNKRSKEGGHTNNAFIC